jgi:hypothetical protein
MDGGYTIKIKMIYFPPVVVVVYEHFAINIHLKHRGRRKYATENRIWEIYIIDNNKGIIKFSFHNFSVEFFK